MGNGIGNTVGKLDVCYALFKGSRCMYISVDALSLPKTINMEGLNKVNILLLVIMFFMILL